jgi:hypothetical protein
MKPHTYTTPGNYTITASTIDGSYSGTAATTIGYAAPTFTVSYNTGETWSVATGTTYQLNVAYADPQGQHVSEFLVDWGDGTVDPVAIPTPSAGNDSQSFTHAFANPQTYNVTVTAVVADGVQQWTHSITATGTYPEIGETITVDSVSGSEGADNAAVAFHDNNSGSMAVDYSVNWGDGTADSTVSCVPGADSPDTYHNYAHAGVYLVTVSGNGDVGYQSAYIGRHTPTVTTAEQVVGAGSGATVSATFADLAAEPNAQAFIDWGDGAGPHAATVTNNGDGTGTITATLPASLAPGAYAATFTLCPLGQGADTDGYQGDSIATATATFTLDVWGGSLGSGSSADVLAASATGTQNLQPITFYYPRPSGQAMNVTITSSDAADNDLWTSDFPSPGDTPALGGSISSHTFYIAPGDPSYQTFYVGALHGNTTYDALNYSITGARDDADSTEPLPTGCTSGVPATAGVSNSASDIGIQFDVVEDEYDNAVLPVGYADGGATSGDPTDLVETDLVYPTSAPTGSFASFVASGADYRFWSDAAGTKQAIDDGRSTIISAIAADSTRVLYGEAIQDSLGAIALTFNGITVNAQPYGAGISVNSLVPSDPSATIADGSSSDPYDTVHLSIPSGLAAGTSVTLSLPASIDTDVEVDNGVPGAAGTATVLGGSGGATSCTWTVGGGSDSPPSVVYAVGLGLSSLTSSFFTLSVAAATSTQPAANKPAAATQPAAVAPPGLLVAFDGTWDFPGNPQRGNTAIKEFADGYAKGNKVIYEAGVGNLGEHGQFVHLLNGGIAAGEAAGKVGKALSDAETFFRQNAANATVPVDIIGYSTGAFEATAFANLLARGITVPWQTGLFFPWIRFVGLLSPVNTNLTKTTLGIGNLVLNWSDQLPAHVGAYYQALYDDSAYSTWIDNINHEIRTELNLPASRAVQDHINSLMAEVSAIRFERFEDHTIFSQTPIGAATGTAATTDNNWADTHASLGLDPGVLAALLSHARAAGVPVH